MKKLHKLFIAILFTQALTVVGQEYTLPLYNNKIPYSIHTPAPENIQKTDIIRISNVQIPDMAVYLPSKRFATGQAVVICPGGGYWMVAYDLEGTDIARFFNSIGVAAIVLKYRMPTNGNCEITYKVPLADAQRAMRLVRKNSSKWNINPEKIGVMGFSAGGHLASTLGTHFDYGDKAATDSVEMQSCRPDFMILMYPVISFVDSCKHEGTKNALLGKNPTQELLNYYSNELQVKEDTPPTFIVHAEDDTTVPVESSLLMYKALRAKKIPTELHILPEGKHGFGLAINNGHVASWTNSMRLWLNWLNLKKMNEIHY